MGICCRLALLLAIAGSLLAQRQMTVAQLTTFIQSSVQLHNDDRQVADFVRKIKLTDRLDLRAVEEMQGRGAGPKTVAALKELSAASAGLAPPPPAVAPTKAATLPPPSPAELKRILNQIRENALNYTKSLPNFICTQVTRRHWDPSGTETWGLVDTIQERLSYTDHKETYQVVMVNNRAVTNVSHMQLGGATSSGEFGSMLQEIFDPETETQFDWERWATLRGKRMYVFAFRVSQARSKYTIREGESKREIVAGYHGLIYADRENEMVMRVILECDTIPLDFPIQQVKLDMNYSFVNIAEQEFLLPLKSEIRSRQGKNLSWNEIEFRLYRKFGAETSITFETPDPIPAEETQETPPKPEK